MTKSKSTLRAATVVCERYRQPLGDVTLALADDGTLSVNGTAVGDATLLALVAHGVKQKLADSYAGMAGEPHDVALAAWQTALATLPTWTGGSASSATVAARAAFRDLWLAALPADQRASYDDADKAGQNAMLDTWLDQQDADAVAETVAQYQAGKAEEQRIRAEQRAAAKELQDKLASKIKLPGAA